LGSANGWPRWAQPGSAEPGRRLGTPLILPCARGVVLNLDNGRNRAWAPAIDVSGVDRPARIYDLRSAFASDALAAGVTAVPCSTGRGRASRARLDAVDANREPARNRSGELRRS
jgi:hypothetical protein